MTTTTDFSSWTNKSRSRRSERGFTLVEVLITVSLMGFVLAVAVSSMVFIAKSSRSLGNYQEMNASSRSVLEQFASDSRMTMDVNFATSDSVSLETYGAAGSTSTIVYAYDAVAGIFTRTEDGVARTLLRDVMNLRLRYFTLRSLAGEATELEGGGIKPTEIKEIQLEATMGRKTLQVDNTNHIISARFMMRNKPVAIK